MLLVWPIGQTKVIGLLVPVLLGSIVDDAAMWGPVCEVVSMNVRLIAGYRDFLSQNAVHPALLVIIPGE